MRVLLTFAVTRNTAISFLGKTPLGPAFRPFCTDKTKMSIRLFEEEDHAKLYAKYRPTYTNEVYDEIRKYCQLPEGSGFNKAVDVGCGSGQSTLPLKNMFENVIGLDISDKQVSQARKQSSGIDFKSGPAEDLSFLGNNTVDLVTTAQAIHWMDRPRFFDEVSRVLRPGGSLVVYGYGNCSIDADEGQQIVQQFYRETLDGYWDKERRHIDDCLATIELPFEGWSRLDSLLISRSWDVDAFVGYLSSWSGWKTFLKSHPDSPILEDIRKRLRTLYTDGNTQEVTSIGVTWPIYMLMGRKLKD